MKFFAVVFMLLSSVAAFAGSASDQGASRIWITDVTIISAENLDHLAEGNVLIEDGRIVSVERRKGTKKPAGATVVSGRISDSRSHRLARPNGYPCFG
jgi:imidazolonepropionase-like amidohydrolase